MDISAIIRGRPYPRRYLIAAAVFLTCCLAGALFWDIRPDKASVIPAPTDPPPAAPVPLPSAMNGNFETQISACFIPVAAVYGYELRITSGFRTVEEQDQVYQQGRTVNGHIVTEAPGGKSIHNYGFAVDVVDRSRGYEINWLRLRGIARFCGVEENDEVGDWPHFEHRGALEIEAFEAGARPPTLILPCGLMADRAAAGQPLTLQDLKECGAPEF